MKTVRKILSNKYVLISLRVILGVVFIWASIDKIAKPEGFAQDIYNYRMLPHSTINLMAIAMPWLELICGVLIIIGLLLRGSALLIGIMLGVFIIALSSALIRGLDISCGCFSVGDGHGVAADLLVRDIFLLAAAAIVLFLGRSALLLRRRANRMN